MSQLSQALSQHQEQVGHQVEVDATAYAADAGNATDLICGEELPHTANEPQEYGQQNEAYILKS